RKSIESSQEDAKPIPPFIERYRKWEQHHWHEPGLVSSGIPLDLALAGLALFDEYARILWHDGFLSLT
ncbi:MAG TPA: hypothetical protein PLS83_12265, partial [Methanothrix soehngenii]|nr:hypothetical protein [Methanothrix soehngenii]